MRAIIQLRQRDIMVTLRIRAHLRCRRCLRLAYGQFCPRVSCYFMRISMPVQYPPIACTRQSGRDASSFTPCSEGPTHRTRRNPYVPDRMQGIACEALEGCVLWQAVCKAVQTRRDAGNLYRGTPFGAVDAYGMILVQLCYMSGILVPTRQAHDTTASPSPEGEAED